MTGMIASGAERKLMSVLMGFRFCLTDFNQISQL